MPNPRAGRALLALAVAAIAAFETRALVLDSPRELTARGQLIDDAFFYTLAAKHLHSEGVLSFDGELPTNGVQPAWMALAAAAQALRPSGDSLPALLALSWLLFAAFAGGMVWLLARGGPPAAAVAAALAFAALVAANPRFQALALRGLETPLLLVLLPAWLALVDRVAARASARAPTPLEVAGLAVAGAAVFLARTDLFWLSACAFAWLLRSGGIARAALFAGVTALCVAPYLAANLAYGGSIVPISGRVKLFYLQSFAPGLGEYLGSQEWRGFFTGFASVFPLRKYGAWFALPCLLAAGYYTVRRRERSGAALRLLGLACALHLVFMYAVYRELRPYSAYYFAATLVFVAAVAARALAELAERRPRLALGLAAGLALLAAIAAWRDDGARDVERYWQTRLALADDIRGIVPAGARLGAFWPGAFAYFAGRDVIPLDGIIGSQAYFESHVKTGRQLDYLREQGGSYLAIFLPLPPDRLRALAEPPRIHGWADIGVLRLWEQRDVAWQAVAERPLDARGSGWYLIRFP